MLEQLKNAQKTFIKDSLLLTEQQLDALQNADAAYRSKVDNMWSSLAAYLAELPDRYEFGTVSKRTDDVIDDAWEVTRLDIQDNFPRILTPMQLSILNGSARQIFIATRRLHIRTFIP